jgi:Tol biopolymer transport system component
VRSGDERQPRLAVLDRAGSVLADLPVGPNGQVGKPQWTPDGRFVFLPAAPDGVRRILAAEPTSGRVFDLSAPHWDAIFALSPDGTRLVLTNGRGSYWLAPVQYH